MKFCFEMVPFQGHVNFREGSFLKRKQPFFSILFPFTWLFASKHRAFHTLHCGQRIITQLRAKLFQTNLDILGKSSKVATDVFAIFADMKQL